MHRVSRNRLLILLFKTPCYKFRIFFRFVALVVQVRSSNKRFGCRFHAAMAADASAEPAPACTTFPTMLYLLLK